MFYFKVKEFYDGKEHTVQGIVSGETFKEAFGKMMEAFNDEDVIDAYLYALSETNVLFIPDSLDEEWIKKEFG